MQSNQSHTLRLPPPKYTRPLCPIPSFVSFVFSDLFFSHNHRSQLRGMANNGQGRSQWSVQHPERVKRRKLDRHQDRRIELGGKKSLSSIALQRTQCSGDKLKEDRAADYIEEQSKRERESTGLKTEISPICHWSSLTLGWPSGICSY